MAARLKLADKPAPLTAERERLRLAIASRDELKKGVAGIINHHSTADAALPWAVWRKALHDDAAALPPS
jgi:hypothetical protein